MKRWIASVLFCFSVAAIAQAPSIYQSRSMARVIFYREKYAAISSSLDSAEIWIDGAHVARVDPKHWIAAEIYPGRHDFRSNTKGYDVVIDLEPGQTYYLRGDELPAAAIKNRRALVQVDAESAAAQMARFKPESKSAVLDDNFFPGFR